MALAGSVVATATVAWFAIRLSRNALVGAAALVAWRMEASGPASDVAAGTAGVERDAPSTREEAAPATQAPPTHASETAPESAAGASTAPSARAGASSADAAASGAEPAPVEIKQLPPRPPRVPRQAAERPPAPAAPVAPATSETVAPAPPARASVAVPAPAPVIDRWARMNDEMSRCTREDFISRVICSQRVRFRYCDGYWGKVAQCPASPAPERGQ